MHDNPSLSDIQKFNYLRAQLHEDASRSLVGFPLTNANNYYQRSVELLQERFGQSHQIINAHKLLMPSWKQCLMKIKTKTKATHSIGQPSAVL